MPTGKDGCSKGWWRTLSRSTQESIPTPTSSSTPGSSLVARRTQVLDIQAGRYLVAAIRYSLLNDPIHSARGYRRAAETGEHRR